MRLDARCLDTGPFGEQALTPPATPRERGQRPGPIDAERTLHITCTPLTAPLPRQARPEVLRPAVASGLPFSTDQMPGREQPATDRGGRSPAKTLLMLPKLILERIDTLRITRCNMGDCKLLLRARVCMQQY